jgi:hypothetical protein
MVRPTPPFGEENEMRCKFVLIDAVEAGELVDFSGSL